MDLEASMVERGKKQPGRREEGKLFAVCEGAGQKTVVGGLEGTIQRDTSCFATVLAAETPVSRRLVWSCCKSARVGTARLHVTADKIPVIRPVLI